MNPFAVKEAGAEHGCTASVRCGLAGNEQDPRPAEMAQMSIRTSQVIVRFSSAFSLAGLDGPQPPGEYRIEQEDELIEGISWLAYRRVATFIHLPAIETGGRARQMAPIDPAELETALEKDQQQS